MKDDQSDGGPSVGKHKSSRHDHNHNKKVSSRKLENNPFGRTHKSAGAKGGGGDSYAKAVRERESRDKRARPKESREQKGRGWSMSPQRSQVSEGPGPEKSHNKKSNTTSSSKGKKLYVPEALPPFYLQSRYSPSWGPEDKKRVKKERSEGEAKETVADAEEAQPKDKPNFEVTGNLMEDTNKIKGVIVKYNEPPEARVPKKRWRLYPFKAGEPLPVLHIHRQSAFMCGRDRRISEIPLDHPSCSKQHAVLQFRSIPLDNGGAGDRRIIKPYVIDLASANGTYLNNARLEPQRYYELMERDVLKFGFSTREYVLLHEHSEGTESEDQQTSLNPAPEGTTVEGDVSEPDYEDG